MSKTLPLLQLRFAPDVAATDPADGSLPSRFAGICYSGGVVPNYGWFGDTAIDLSTLKAPTKALFALLNHDPDQRVGKCQIGNDGQSVSVDGAFLKTATGQQVAAEFADGAPWEFSVAINATPEVFGEPITLDLNGRSLTVDTILRNASVREVSFVPAGADPNTRAVAFTQENCMSEPNLLELSRSLDAEKAAKIELEGRLTVLTGELETVKVELAGKIADLDDALKESDFLRDRSEKATAELTALKQAARLDAVKALFSDLGREVTDESVKPYLGLADEVFALMAADLRAVKAGKTDAALFHDQATDGRDGSPESNVVALAADLRAKQPTLTQEQAVARVLSSNPTLYADPRNLGAR